jgi:hypothetical protein
MRIGVFGRDSGLGGGIEGVEHVSGSAGRTARLLGGALGSNGCRAFLLLVDRRARLGIHVPKILLPGSEASLRKESRRFWRHDEQYFESISDVKVAEL